MEANLSKANFLDVTLDLKSGKYSPYTKEENTPLYAHKQSNHPPSILRNIQISSDKDCFDKAKDPYQDTLNKSGYKYNLSFKTSTPDTSRKNKNLQRNILWFNPPYSQNVETKVGKCFLQLIDQHFPKSKSLHKIFNCNTVKLSYSCMNNVKSIISSHNKAQINKPSKQSDQIDNSCNCRNKNSCPLEGNCNTRNIIYQAEVTTPQTTETYIGLCDTTFKERYRNQTCSFRNERYKNVTDLSKHIWSLKERQINYQIKWKKVRQARSYSNVNKKCNLCLWEKYFIICKPEMSTLNRRNEMTNFTLECNLCALKKPHGETRRRNKRSCGKCILRDMYARDTLEQAPW